MNTPTVIFADCTIATEIDELCRRANGAGQRAAASDLGGEYPLDISSDESTVAALHAPDTETMLREWLRGYRHDDELLTALPDAAREQVFRSAWLGYEAIVMQARDTARSAA